MQEDTRDDAAACAAATLAYARKRANGPSIETRGDVMTALMRIDEQLHHNAGRGLVDWPFKPVTRILRSVCVRLEAEDAGETVTWEDDNGTVLAALREALQRRTPIAYFGYGAIDHSGGFHEDVRRWGEGEKSPNRPGWFYFEAEHGQWAGPFESEEDARMACGLVGDE